MNELEKTDIYRVDCPHCGVPAGGVCEETDRIGPNGGYRPPHQERRELAREVAENE